MISAYDTWAQGQERSQESNSTKLGRTEGKKAKLGKTRKAGMGAFHSHITQVQYKKPGDVCGAKAHIHTW